MKNLIDWQVAKNAGILNPLFILIEAIGIYCAIMLNMPAAALVIVSVFLRYTLLKIKNTFPGLSWLVVLAEAFLIFMAFVKFI